MNNSVTIVIRDLTTGAGRGGLTVWLRHKTDNYATNIIQATAVTGKTGVYQAPNVPYNLYKLWVNGTEDNTLGGDDGRWLPNGDEVIRLNNSDWDAKDLKLINLADPSTATGALNRQSGDARYIKLADAGDYVDVASEQTITGDKNFTGESTMGILNLTQFGSNASLAGWRLSGAVSSDDDPGSSLMSKTWIAAAIAAAIAGVELDPYQESPNEIRLIQGGSTKTGQVYTTWNAAMGYLVSLDPSTTKRFIIEIAGAGLSSINIPVTENDGGAPPTYYLNNYISLFIKNRLIRLLLPTGDISMGYSAIGNGTIEGGTTYLNDSGSNPVLNNIYYVNHLIDLNVNTVVFNNCKFENCYIKVNTDSTPGDATFTNCTGSNVTCNQALPSTISGIQEKPKADF